MVLNLSIIFQMEAINTSLYRNFNPFMHPFLLHLSSGHYNATWEDVLESKKDRIGEPRTLYAIEIDITGMRFDSSQESTELIRRRSRAGRWVREGTKDVIFTPFLNDRKFLEGTLDHNLMVVFKVCIVSLSTSSGRQNVRHVGEGAGSGVRED